MSSVKKTLLNWVGDRFLSQAIVVQVDAPSDRFRFITLKSEDFAKAKWNPGDKIQIDTGDWNVRTYTPLTLDRALKTIRILAFLHGDTPGARWASSVKAGDECKVLGPRSSLDFSTQPTPVVFFGDETSFGAASVLNAGVNGVTRFVFEVANARESEKVLEQIGIGAEKVTLLQKNLPAPPKLAAVGAALATSNEHLAKVAEQLRYTFKRLNSAHFVFTGNANSIRVLRGELREIPAAVKNMKVKAYWAEGKVGID